MKTIHFSENYNNKLFCNCFCTIRLSEGYYQCFEYYSIILDTKDTSVSFGSGKIVFLKEFLLDELNLGMSMWDTGLHVEPAKSMIMTMYKNHNIDWKQKKLEFIVIEKDLLSRIKHKDISVIYQKPTAKLPEQKELFPPSRPSNYANNADNR